MKSIGALFDCDGTLYSAQYGRGLMKYSSENGRKRSARAYYASLFDMVGHPVAVSPDEKLLELARSKNWEVIGESRIATE